MTQLTILHDVPLSPLTTLGIGGKAAHFVRVTSINALREACDWAASHDQAITILGGGSNVLAADEGVSGLTIHIAIEGMEFVPHGEHVHARVGAGVVLDEFVAETVRRGLWGIENLSAIPGSIGATPIQNVGAYGVEVSSLIESVEVFDRITGEVRVLMNRDCVFGYRDSMFKHEGGTQLVVSAVTFVLDPKGTANISYKDLANYFGARVPLQHEVRDAVMEVRSKKFPDWHTLGTAGSFFKNPIVTKETYEALQKKYPEIPAFVSTKGTVKLSLSWILDHVLNLKGKRAGSVGLYDQHVLVLVNHGGATANDVRAFANEIQAEVKKVLDLDIDWEVSCVH